MSLSLLLVVVYAKIERTILNFFLRFLGKEKQIWLEPRGFGVNGTRNGFCLIERRDEMQVRNENSPEVSEVFL